MVTDMKTSKNLTKLPFIDDLNAIAAQVSEIGVPSLQPDPWTLVIKRCPFYPANLQEPARNYIKNRVSEILTVRRNGNKHTDPFAVSKRLHSSALKHLPYQQFLASPYWMAFRAEKIKQSGGRCSSCENIDSLQVHHLRYNNRGYECFKPRDTIVLCAFCHSQRH